ncbi:hypothetical protein AKJ41_02835 [candidate division MSBL1 archaeon SCGC-AAA259O05]|uniref:Uncharacterized protein n=1 Tax=candidate division MSBL1 archaeon SCGC-AAA259O05 TaxID=1698271 RepID=A0A133V3R4_9EURY|nr:hypothetical protein AKJ41_02835 [candidate division MSBL1 archaeon SCGC-AAA259O05]
MIRMIAKAKIIVLVLIMTIPIAGWMIFSLKGSGRTWKRPVMTVYEPAENDACVYLVNCENYEVQLSNPSLNGENVAFTNLSSSLLRKKYPKDIKNYFRESYEQVINLTSVLGGITRPGPVSKVQLESLEVMMANLTNSFSPGDNLSFTINGKGIENKRIELELGYKSAIYEGTRPKFPDNRDNILAQKSKALNKDEKITFVSEALNWKSKVLFGLD